jgi:hypothetical protein
MFIDGGDFEEIFESTKGPVRVFAEVHLADSHLILYEVLFFPDNGEEFLDLGVRQVLEIVRAIRLLARDAGFEKLTMIYHRIGGKHSGRTIIRTRSLP